MSRAFNSVYVNPLTLSPGNIVVEELWCGPGCSYSFKRVVKVNKKTWTYQDCDQNGISTNREIKKEKILFFSKRGIVPEAIFYPDQDLQPLAVSKLTF